MIEFTIDGTTGTLKVSIEMMELLTDEEYAELQKICRLVKERISTKTKPQ